MSTHGAKKIYFLAVTICSIFNCLFFLVGLVSQPTVFLVLSTSLVILSTIGDAGIFCSIYVLAAQETAKDKEDINNSAANTSSSNSNTNISNITPSSSNSTTNTHTSTSTSSSAGPALMETTYAVGSMAGPLLGGLLYHWLGWSGLSLTVGLSMTVVGLATGLAYTRAGLQGPADRRAQTEATSPQAAPLSHLSAVRRPWVAAACLCMVASGVTSSWYLSSLEAHLSLTLGLAPATVALVYMCPGLVYALLTPLTGLLLDRGVPHLLLLLPAVVANLLGYLLLGPSPLLGLPPSLPATICGLLLHGLGLAITLMTCLSLMTHEAGAGDEAGAGIVTSLWECSELVGGYLGSSLGGLAAQRWGFREATAGVVGLEAAVLILLVIMGGRRCHG